MDQIVEPKSGIDWYGEILDIWDRPIPIENGEPMSLLYVVVEALGAGYPDEDKLSGDERAKRWTLATKLKGLGPNDSLKLKSEEITLIKTIVPKRWPQSFVVGQVFKLIDPGER